MHLLACLVLLGTVCKLRVTEAFKSAPSSSRMLFSCSFFGQISHVKNTPGHPCLFCPLLFREDLCLATTMLSRCSFFLSQSHSHNFSVNLPLSPSLISPIFILFLSHRKKYQRNSRAKSVKGIFSLDLMAQEEGSLMDKRNGRKIQCRHKCDLGRKKDNAIQYRQRNSFPIPT